MQEDLLGYLLGALEPDEMRRVEQWLRGDAEARRELAELERVLKRLEEADELDAGVVDSVAPTPPADLVSRTLANLPPLPPMDDHSAPEAPWQNRAAGEENIFSDRSLSQTQEEGEDESWGLRDWGASIVAAVILIAIAMPALLEGRFAARKVACQDNLRELGVAMTQFASRNAQSRLPSVAPDGYQAFAGMYALRLHEAGLLDRPRKTFCPSIDPRDLTPPSWSLHRTRPAPGASQPERPMFVTLRTLDEIGRELADARGAAIGVPDVRQRMMHAIEKLRWIQMTAGGDYAYTLGVRDGGQFSSPRFEARSQFAVMSDAVTMQVNVANALSTDHAAYRFNVSSHGGRGFNVLYEDGHVGFLPSGSLGRIPDNPLINHEGLLEAGVTIDDASLGPSWQPPFIHATQR